MPRRVSLPGAEELFRPTVRPEPAGSEAAGSEAGGDAAPVPGGVPRASGRVKHDEKITVYVTRDELLALERARLDLRAELGRNVDRGRVVRAALALALADLSDRGSDSDLARRLGGG